MYECEYRDRKRNPKERANFLSLITFFYIRDIFRKSIRRDLVKDDVYEVLKTYESEKLGNDIETEWNKERLKKDPSLLKVLIRCFGWETIIIGIHLLFHRTIFMICQPFLIEKLIIYFKPEQNVVTLNQAHLYGIVLILLLIFKHTYYQNCEFLMSQLAIKARTALSSLIYRKALKLSQTSVVEISSGRIVSLISKDINTVEETIICTNMLWTGGVQLIVLTYILYSVVGLSAFVGVGYMFISIPIEMSMGIYITKLRKQCGANTDERLRLTQEILTTMKIIKMFTWEPFYTRKINQERKAEMMKLRWVVYLKGFIMTIGKLSIRISFYLCIITYLYFGAELKTEQVFVVLTCYETVRDVLSMEVPISVGNLSETTASLYRIKKLLQEPDMTLKRDVEMKGEPNIKLTNVVVAVNSKKYIFDGLNLEIKRGLTALVGAIGTGKSTLLKAILQDVKIVSGDIETIGIVSYASQEPWIFNGTLRQNILFGEPYNAERYDKIINICALRKDIDRLPDGDQSIVIDNGLNLSRGQQVRINLARAVYKQADIYLLDDSLSSLDSNVGRFIFDNCIKDFLKNNLCVFITHESMYIREVDDVLVIKNGKVLKEKEEDKCSNEILKSHVDSYEIHELVDEDESKEIKEHEDTTRLFTKSDVYIEDNKIGRVEFKTYKMYFSSGHALHFLILAALFTFAASTCGTYFDYYVTKWTDTEEKIGNITRNNLTHTLEYDEAIKEKSEVPIRYSLLITLNVVLDVIETIAFYQFAMRASVALHNKIFSKIIKATMAFFDLHMTGNVLNRFAKDVGIIDEQLPFCIYNTVPVFLSIFGIFTLIVSVHYIFLLYTVIFTLALYLMSNYYLPAGRSLKRLEGSTRAPIVGHISATLKGLTTIRANQAQNILIKQFDKHQDLHSSTCHMNLALSRGFSYYSDLLSTAYTAIIIFTFLHNTNGSSASKVGLAITQSFGLSGLIRNVIFARINLENYMTSVERVTEYLSSESEDEKGLTTKDWPQDGQIKFCDVSLKYHTNPTHVLKGINFDVQPREKIAIIGRTGAGKSSIISVLFRLYDVSGSVKINKQDIKALQLNYLRSNMSIIPQDPILITGTLRTNLDPDNEYTDESLWRALEVVRAKEMFHDINDMIEEGGTNYSIGQKQLICLARAFLKKHKIVILDEATANIDPLMDALIQSTIRKEFRDCTILTIIHHLDGIMSYDKVLILDKGRLIEFDTPSNLCKNKNSFFYSMARQAGII